MSHGNQLHGHKDTTEISQGLSHVKATATDTPNCQTQSLPFGWLVPRGLIPDRDERTSTDGTLETRQEREINGERSTDNSQT